MDQIFVSETAAARNLVIADRVWEDCDFTPIKILGACDHIVIRNCIFRNIRAPAIWIGDKDKARQSSWRRIVIEGCLLEDIQSFHGILVTGVDVIVRGCQVHGVTASRDGQGIYVRAERAIVSDNIVTGCVGVGIALKGGSPDADVPTGRASVVSGNVVAGCAGGIRIEHGDAVVSGNLLDHNATNGLAHASTSKGRILHTGNLLLGNNLSLAGGDELGPRAADGNYLGDGARLLNALPGDSVRTIP